MIGGIDTIQTQGTLQSTGKLTDMAIQGDGFFVMNDGQQKFFSRDGAFDLGIDGTIVNPSNGLHVMGWMANTVTGAINTGVPPTNITVPVGAGMTGRPSTTLTTTGNLDAGAVVGAASGTVVLATTMYDSLGNALNVNMTFTKTGVNAWTIAPTAPYPAGVTAATIGGAASVAITFNSSGRLATVNGAATPLTTPVVLTLTNGSTTPQTVTMDPSQITQLASTPSNLSSNTDGASAGSLTTFTVGQAGDITGIYSNGYKTTLGQIALAGFANPSGLVKSGGNLFSTSPNSGTPNIGVAGSSGRGQIATGFLEGSNVDLAQQFTNMIMAERGFQANSKVITTSDEILLDLVNLKH
jgi:flagellar hook protein FlgE